MEQIVVEQNQLEVANYFLKSINEKDYFLFWNLLSRESQGFIFGLHCRNKSKELAIFRNEKINDKNFRKIEYLMIPIVNKLNEILTKEGYLPDYRINNELIYESEYRVLMKIMINIVDKTNQTSDTDEKCRILPEIKELRYGKLCWAIDYMRF